MSITAKNIAIAGVLIGLSACTIQPKTRVSSSDMETIQSAAEVAISCQTLPQPANQCDVNVVDGSNGIVIFGDVLASEGVIRNGSVSIDELGKISYVGCQAIPADRTSINCAGSVVSPGLINAHDHLKYNQNPPGGLGDSRYSHCNVAANAFTDSACEAYRFDRRNEWRKGLNGKYQVIAPGTGDNAVVVWNELRHIIAGTTTVAGSGGATGLVRNPDVKLLTEGLVTPDNKIVDYDTFPLGDTTDVQGHVDSCQYPDIADKSVLDNLVFLPHVAEGVDAFAHNEILCMTARGSDHNDRGVSLAATNSSFVHGLATNEVDAATLASRGTSIVWSPRSNISLYGHTAPVINYSKKEINIALASDWTPSGSMNLLRELQCASDFSDIYLSGHFSSYALWLMVTKNAAKALGLDNQIGAIKEGYWADIVILPNSETSNIYDSFIGIDAPDILLTLRGGAPLYGETELVMALDSKNCESFDGACGAPKSVCLKDTGLSLSQLKASNQGSYKLAHCSATDVEPSCTPSRYGEYSGEVTSQDYDGDGVLNKMDNCPKIFNPPRPMDSGKQINVCLD